MHRYYLILIIALLTGCEEQLPRSAPLEARISMYGVLSPDLDTQSVRVYIPEKRPTLGTSEAPPIEIVSIDLQTGERRVWRDSVIVEANGQHGYVYWAQFRPEFGRRYRIEAVDYVDDETSFAEVQVPSRVSVDIDESRAPLLDVIISGNDVRLLKPEAIYDVDKGPPLLRFEVSYEGREEVIDDGWLVPLNLIVDAFEINFAYNGIVFTFGGHCNLDFVILRGLSIRAIVGDESWNPPGGLFDPNVLSQPETFDNVENGLGFIGAGYMLDEDLAPSRETVESACFRYGFPPI